MESNPCPQLYCWSNILYLAKIIHCWLLTVFKWQHLGDENKVLSAVMASKEQFAQYIISASFESLYHNKYTLAKICVRSSGQIRVRVNGLFVHSASLLTTQSTLQYLPHSPIHSYTAHQSESVQYLRHVAEGSRDSNQQSFDYLMTCSTSWGTATCSRVLASSREESQVQVQTI